MHNNIDLDTYNKSCQFQQKNPDILGVILQNLYTLSHC